jgi:hypothetical protein
MSAAGIITELMAEVEDQRADICWLRDENERLRNALYEAETRARWAEEDARRPNRSYGKAPPGKPRFKAALHPADRGRAA